MNALDYYLGPTGIPDKLRAAGRALNYLNPVNALGESMQASRRLFAPETDGWGRVQATGDMLTGMAGVVAPSAVASRAGMPAANALQEGLMGFAYSPGVRMAADDAGRFVADEDAALRLYHGSGRKGLDELVPSPEGTGALGPGVYGSPFRPTAEIYTGGNGQIYEFDAPENIFLGAGSRWDDIPSDVNSYQVWRDQVARLADANPDQADMIREAGARMTYDGYPFFRELAYRTGSKEAAQQLYKNAGFDGLSAMVDGPEVVMFSRVPVGNPARPATSLNPSETRAQNVLDYLTSGRASEVTDEMLEGADPQYLYRNYDLPMDYDSRMARADAGWPGEGLHGSTHNFSAFGGGSHNPEGHFGAGNYLSDSPLDVSRHYAGDGPDLTNRIQQRAEQLADEMGVNYDDPAALTAARAELRGETDGVIYPLRYAPGNQFDAASGKYVAADRDSLDPADFLKEAGGDFDLAQELATEATYDMEPQGPFVNFSNALRNDPRVSDISALDDVLIEGFYEGGLPMSKIDEAMRKAEWYSEDDFGRLVNNDVYADALRAAGYDTFKHPGDIFRGMDVPAGTQHTIVPDPTRIRSRFARFDPRLAHLRNLSAGIGALGLFGDYDQRDNALGGL